MTVYTVKIIRLTDIINWYKVGDVFRAEFDPRLGAYVGVSKGTGRRCINVEDCGVIEND